MRFSAEDHAFMARALALTRFGSETATPNPNVGCVIVKSAAIIGEGWHERAGEAHAEVNAIRACARDPRGATAYVTLEPCAHHGRTPPCVDALVAAGVSRVVAAIDDPDPRVSGKGMAALHAAGILAQSGLMADEARRVHRGFLSRVTRGRPWLRVKIGASLDGRTALANGESRWITGDAARRDVHRLRAQSCAVLTGIGTVRLDDPQLTVRDVPCRRQPLRVLLDSRLDVDDAAKILQGGNLAIVTATGDETRARALRERGIEVIRIPVEPVKGKVDLRLMVEALAARGLNDVLVETGARFNGSLIEAGVVDEVIVYVAPGILGDTGRGMVAIAGLASLDDRFMLEYTDVRSVGADLRITARVMGR